MRGSILYFRGHRFEFPNYDVFVSFIIENSVDRDEMLHVTAFYLGLLCFAEVPI